MRIQCYQMIEKTKNQQMLTDAEIAYLVNGFTKQEIPDYMMSAWLMAVCCQGLTTQETVSLTVAMRDSGACLDVSDIGHITVDKHSTGGIGDKTTLMLAPIVAACGGYVPKMSGRGLGITGGTIDKLESIPGFAVHLSEQQFIKQVRTIGCSIIAQSGNLTPADKKIYALRNLTATVESIPLICSSIMSKKLALGADCILLDVKFGRGAFMKTAQDAEALANLMVDVGKQSGKQCRALLTDMNAPLGYAVGNALEVKEAISILKCEIKNQLTDFVLDLAAHMLALSSGQALPVCRAQAAQALVSGKALEKFAAMIEAQGGDASVIDYPERLPSARCIKFLKAEQSGFLSEMDSQIIGMTCQMLGTGRTTEHPAIDMSAGIVLLHEIGDAVHKNDILCTIYGNSETICEEAVHYVRQAFHISESAVTPTHFLYKTIL